MRIIKELKRRNVFRVGAAYIVAAWLLIQVAETVFPLFGFGDAPARIVVILLAIGFPLFLVFSWVFEFTPEGLKKEKDINRSQPSALKTGKRLDRSIIVLLALGLGYFAIDKFVFDPARVKELVEETAKKARSEALVESYGDQSIAVLPFVNMSDDAANEYFSDGISEELLNLLGQLPGLRVTARTSSFSFKGKDTPVRDIARQLDVAHVLEGSVRKAGSRVRITAQLIEARSDTHVWSDTFDRDLNDIFMVQDEIAREIGEVLKIKFALGDTSAPPSMVPSATIDAYDLYLKGRAAVRHRDPGSLAEAIGHFEHALRLDAKFVPAHAQLAIAILLQVQVGASTLEDARLGAAPHIEQALKLEPDLVEVHHARALLERVKNQEAIIEHAKRALALNPNYVDVQIILAGALNRLGRYEEAEKAFEDVIVMDPLNIMGLLNYGDRLNHLGRHDEAHELADRLVELDSAWGYHGHAYTSALYEGKIAEGLEWALKEDGVCELASFAFMWIGEYEEARRLGRADVWVDNAEGRDDEAIEKTRRAVERDPNNIRKITAAATVLYQAGRVSEALPLLERALDLSPDGRPIVSHLDLYMTMMLARARQQSGDELGAEAAASIARQDHAARVATGRRHVNLDLWGADIALFDGDYDKAFAYLESSVDKGLRDKAVFKDFDFDNIRDDPRFIAIQTKFDAILAEEHEKVLQLICFNNPVPDIWRPMPETCERVVEQPRL
jgi:TolB-like protein/Tfp pilus assembly protein PilF